jgi:hypothetical protein
VLEDVVRLPGSLTLTAPNGVDVFAAPATAQAVGIRTVAGRAHVAGGVRLRAILDVEAGGIVRLGERAAAAGAEVQAGGDVFLGDAVRLRRKAVGPVRLLSGGDVVVGNGVLLRAAEGEVHVAADPVTGSVDAGRLTAQGETVRLEGAGIVLRTGTRLRGTRKDAPSYAPALVTLTATEGIGATGVRIDTRHGVALAVTSGDALVFQYGRIVGAGADVATFSTPPGGVCDVTGTVFEGITPEFVGCTPVGP